MAGSTKLSTFAAGTLGLLTGARFLQRRLRSIDLRDRVAVVTGGSRGLGLAIARELASHGCRVALCARDADELERARTLVVKLGADVLARACDVTDREAVEAFIDEVDRELGPVDILVNNAGVMSVGPVHNQALEDFELAHAVMYWGVVYPTLAVVPAMRSRGFGRIVNITSIGGRVSVPHLLPYNAAKFAAVGFSEGLRAELLEAGIFVTTVIPGLMRTGSSLNAVFKGDADAELRWFSRAAGSPLMAMRADRAARRIVRALRSGDAELILTPQAKLLSLMHGVFPGLTTEILSLANRLLPEAALVHEPAPMLERQKVLSRSAKKAARDLNQPLSAE
jgi:NAD(P)-dependent dehydrogenase (short-subunit alcohol dehydrogenase family)